MTLSDPIPLRLRREDLKRARALAREHGMTVQQVLRMAVHHGVMTARWMIRDADLEIKRGRK